MSTDKTLPAPVESVVMRRCGRLIKRGFQKSPARKCHAVADSRLVTVGPLGERIDQGTYCEKHARLTASRFAQKNGWRVEIEKVA